MAGDREVAISASALILITCAQILINKTKRRRRKMRRWWMVSLNRNKSRYDGSDLLHDLERSRKFENVCRMSPEDFDHLLNLIGPQITKKDTIMRKAISAKVRFAVTLRFLATGDSFQSLGYLFKISAQLISQIVPDVCTALISVLKDEIKVNKLFK